VTDEREAGGEGQEQRPRGAADRRGRRSAPGGRAEGPATGKGRPTSVRDRRPEGGSIFDRISRYLREVVAELRKVIWPTRRQLVTYTVVVLGFVSFMVALVALLDWLFGQGVLFLFGT